MTVIALIALMVLLAISWAGSCMMLWLICWCFGWAFSLPAATGAWLVVLVLKNIFSGGSKK